MKFSLGPNMFFWPKNDVETFYQQGKKSSKRLFGALLISTAIIMSLIFSSCVSKKKKKCNTCPDWGKIEVEK